MKVNQHLADKYFLDLVALNQFKEEKYLTWEEIILILHTVGHPGNTPFGAPNLGHVFYLLKKKENKNQKRI